MKILTWQLKTQANNNNIMIWMHIFNSPWIWEIHLSVQTKLWTENTTTAQIDRGKDYNTKQTLTPDQPAQGSMSCRSTQTYRAGTIPPQ